MADENQPEQNVNIQGTVNPGTQATGSEATGVKIERLTARDVHVHGDTAPPPPFRNVAIVGVLAFLSAILINYATSLPLPETWRPYLWVTWPLAVLVIGISIWVAYRQSRSTNSAITIGSTVGERNRAR